MFTVENLPAGKSVTPPGSLIYAIGDVHGCLDLLDRLLDGIADDAGSFDADRQILVFVGDYVDRGPDSAGVIERISAALPPGFEAICLKGNHEAMMLDFLQYPAEFGLWRHNGGEATIVSYGVDPRSFADDETGAAACRDALQEAMPVHHLRFLETLQLSAMFGGYFFAHAGVMPGVPLERQQPKHLMWVRHAFLNSSEDFGKVVVHGHTPRESPQISFNRIGIDTGVLLYGRLTALRLRDTARAILSVES